MYVPMHVLKTWFRSGSLEPLLESQVSFVRFFNHQMSTTLHPSGAIVTAFNICIYWPDSKERNGLLCQLDVLNTRLKELMLNTPICLVLSLDERYLKYAEVNISGISDAELNYFLEWSPDHG